MTGTTQLIQSLPAVDIAKPEPDDLRMYSVTTILGVLDKPALLYWAADETAKAAVRIAKSLPERIAEEGEEEVARWLAGARFRRPKGLRSATQLGTDVHSALEELALTGKFPEVDEEVRPFVEQFDRWAQKFQPRYLASEMCVYDSRYSYAGTLDAIAEVGGQICLLDYKSSRKSVDSQGNPTHPYPEQVGLQLAAYRYAEMAATWRPRRFEQFRRRYYCLSQAERDMAVPVPEVDGCLVIHVTPSHCKAYPIRADEQVYQHFLFTLECARWIFDVAKGVMGDPLE